MKTEKDYSPWLKAQYGELFKLNFQTLVFIRRFFLVLSGLIVIAMMIYGSKDFK